MGSLRGLVVGERLRRIDIAEAGMPRDERLRRLDVEACASTEASAVTFIGPNPGSEPSRFFRSAASAASLQIREASPP